MARAIFPAADPVYGALPFPLRAVVLQKPATVVVDAMPIALWPARARVDDNGAYSDHDAEAPLVYLPQLNVPNRIVVINGERYTIVAATPHTFLPHVALRLRRAQGSAV